MLGGHLLTNGHWDWANIMGGVGRMDKYLCTKGNDAMSILAARFRPSCSNANSTTLNHEEYISSLVNHMIAITIAILKSTR